MHGQIGDIGDRSHHRSDLDFYYRTREALIEAQRHVGGGAIDYEFHRRRAHRLRGRVRRRIFRGLLPYVRPFAAIAAIAAAIFMLPWPERDCPACVAPVAHHYSLTSNR